MSNEETIVQLADALEPRAPSAQARARLLAALHGPERWTLYADEVAQAFALTRDDALDALQRIEGDGWTPGVWAGSQMLRTPALIAVRALIARVPGGLAIPHHKHAGRELTFLLDGELIEDGRVYRSGELVDKAPGSEHALQVGSHCLVVFGLPA